MHRVLSYLTGGGFPGVQPRALPGGRILDDGGLAEAAVTHLLLLTVHRAAGQHARVRRSPGSQRVQDQRAFARAQGVEPQRSSGGCEGVQLTRGGRGRRGRRGDAA